MARTGDCGDPTCTECPYPRRRSRVTYRCVVCDWRFTVDGAYCYEPQGKGHFHKPDGEVDGRSVIGENRNRHVEATGCKALFVPASGEEVQHLTEQTATDPRWGELIEGES